MKRPATCQSLKAGSLSTNSSEPSCNSHPPGPYYHRMLVLVFLLGYIQYMQHKSVRFVKSLMNGIICSHT
jgi:hypothetical protein